VAIEIYRIKRNRLDAESVVLSAMQWWKKAISSFWSTKEQLFEQKYPQN